MSEKYLHRDDAPFGDKVWEKIDEAVIGAAKSQLSGRRLLPIQGPYGLGLKNLPTGDRPVDEKTTGRSQMDAPCVTPLAAIYAEFELPVRDVAAFEQYGLPLDLAPAAQAAMDCARQEDQLVFNGSKKCGLQGLMDIKGSCSEKLKPWDSIGMAIEDIIRAVTALDKNGFHGPYTLGLAVDLYNLLFRRYPQGNQTEMGHLKDVITGGIVKSPAVASGGILLSSGVPFVSIVLGQDLMTGFVGPGGHVYEFTISETVALKATVPGAICVLKK
jgi:uncharacterized linocin/CFP29 family protein